MRNNARKIMAYSVNSESDEQKKFALRITKLAEKEHDYKWSHFPEHYVNTRPKIDPFVKQISDKYPSIHVIARLTDNLEMFQESGLADDNNTPLKVLCWNDISSLTAKMASKTIKAGLEREYNMIHDDITMTFQSVNVGDVDNNNNLLENLQSQPDILVYHVLDPTIPQVRKLGPKHAIPPSDIPSHLVPEGARERPRSSTIAFDVPIQQNKKSLKNLSSIYSNQNTIFIFDCSFAERSMKSLLSEENSDQKPFTIFAATSQLLNYSSHLPYDLFTSCLLTPGKVALLWQSQNVGHFQSGLLKEIEIQTFIDQISDSPAVSDILNMLNSALEAIADKIAIDLILLSSDPNRFFHLFRRDAFTSHLFYNYMFATRVMSTLAMTPSSYPPIPDSSNHPFWDTFDLHVDRAILALVDSFQPLNVPRSIFSIDNLLEEAIARLKSWLRFPKQGRKVPNEICFIPMLLLSSKFFEEAIVFCSHFLQISTNTVRVLLYTRTFPVLPQCLERIRLKLGDFKPEIIAAFSFVVVDSVLLVPSLASYFKDKTDFWFQFIPATSIDEHLVPTASESYITTDTANETFEQTSEEVDEQQFHDQQLLIIASLSVLLIFLDDEHQVQLYKENKIDVRLKQLEQNDSHPRIRCLSNLILAELNVEFDVQVENRTLSMESNPLCRAAALSRFNVTIQKVNSQICNFYKSFSSDDNENPVEENDLENVKLTRDDLMHEVIQALDDPYPLVREEALVVISKALNLSTKNQTVDFTHNHENAKKGNKNVSKEEDNQELRRQMDLFFNAIDTCLRLPDYDPGFGSIPRFLVEHLTCLLYEPSLRVNERLIEFCQFLTTKLDGGYCDSLESNLKNSCLLKLSHTSNRDETPSTVIGTETLVPPSNPNNSHLSYHAKFFNVQNNSSIVFIGKPAISPSGLFACGDKDGRITYQTAYEEFGQWKTKTITRDCFESSVDISTSFEHFKPLHQFQAQNYPTINYMKFIDDSKLLLVSSRSQVVVLDMNLMEDPICAFWAQQPYSCHNSVADYNNHNFSLIQASSFENDVGLFDFVTQQKVNDFQISENQTISGMQWLQPYTTLFYVAQDDILLFDTRTKAPISKTIDAGKYFIGGNISYTLPFNFVVGNNANKQGMVSMFDLRKMEKITSSVYPKELREFDVHKHLPFSVAIADSLLSFNFEQGMLISQQQKIGFIPQSFSLHHSEPLVAIRYGNKVQSAKIIY